MEAGSEDEGRESRLMKGGAIEKKKEKKEKTFFKKRERERAVL